jgi:hypothetical protein
MVQVRIRASLQRCRRKRGKRNGLQSLLDAPAKAAIAVGGSQWQASLRALIQSILGQTHRAWTKHVPCADQKRMTMPVDQRRLF